MMNAVRVRIIISVVWIVLVMAGAYFGKDVFVKTETQYNGTPVVLTLEGEESLVINGVTNFEAASESHFILQSASDRIIESRYTPPSFGNKGDNHTVAVEDLPSDRWAILQGSSVDIQLKAENGVQASLEHSPKQINVDYFFFYAACFSSFIAGLFFVWKVFGPKAES